MDGGHFSSLKTVMTVIRILLEKVSLPCELGQLFPVGCEVEQASQNKARYGALDLPRSLDSHAWPEGMWGLRACQESVAETGLDYANMSQLHFILMPCP